jgi:hypothetical protein
MDRDPPFRISAYGKTHGVERFAGTRVASKAEMKDKEHWTELCRQAAVEQDPKKMLQLVTEINRLLAEKQDRLEKSSRTEDRR